MKKLLAALTAFLLLLFCSCDANFGVIARIEFSNGGKTAEARHITYDLFAVEGKQVDPLPLLENIKPKLDYGKLLSAFGMEKADYTSFSDPAGRKYKTETKTLVVYESGLISFSDTSLYGKGNTFTDEQLRQTGEETAKNAGLDLSELTLAEWLSAEEARTAAYDRKIGGVEAVGRTGMNITYNGDGISGLTYLASTYKNKTEQTLLTVGEAAKLLLTEESSQSFGREVGVAVKAIETVTVTDVDLVYWDSTYTQTRMMQTHIQPVYRFTGICLDTDGKESPFTGYVRAVPDSETTDFYVDPETIN